MWRMAKRRACIIVRKACGRITPVSAFDEEELDRFPAGAEFDMKPRTKRSNPQNRLYWLTLSRVVAGTEQWATREHLHDALLRELGYERVGMDLSGRPYITRDSTAFDRMSTADFGDYFEKAMARLAEAGLDPAAAQG